MSNFSLPQVCGQLLPSEDEFLTDLKFWGPGVAVSIIGGIGLVGNILSIIAIATLPKTRLSLFYKVSKKNGLLLIYVFHAFFPAFTYTGDFRFPIHFQWWVIYDSAGIWIQS